MNLAGLFEIFGLSFGVVDIIYLAILVIVIIVGVAKGFVNFVLLRCKGIIAFVVAFFACKPIANWASPLLKDGIYPKILEWINGLNPIFTTALPGGEANAEAIREGVDVLNLPTFLDNIIVNTLKDTTEATIGEAVASYLYLLAFTIVSFIVIFIVVRIIIFIFRKLFKKITKKSAVGTIDHIFGAFAGLAFALVVISIISIGLSYVISLNFWQSATDFLVNDIGVGNDSINSLSKFIYDNNPLLIILNLF